MEVIPPGAVTGDINSAFFYAIPISAESADESKAGIWWRKFSLQLRMSHRHLYRSLMQGPFIKYTSGGPVAYTNVGDAPTDNAKVTINGPITNPVISDVATGKKLTLSLTVAVASRIMIDFRNRTIKTSAGADLSSSLDLLASDWWDRGEGLIHTGAQQFEMTGTSTDANTKAELSFYPAVK